MARSRSSTNRLRYLHPSYYLKRPKRLTLLFIVFVAATVVVWDRQTLTREHEFLEWVDEGAKCPYCEGLGQGNNPDTVYL